MMEGEKFYSQDFMNGGAIMDFFNEIGKKFTKAARSVQDLTREGVENTRLAADLRSARSELERRFADLGRAYYETLSDGGEVPAELVSRVRATMEGIEALLAQKERARAQVRCPDCGAMQPEDARFCSSCGRRMPEPGPEPADEPPASEDGAEYCAECGAMREGNAKYCAVCGFSFDDADAPAPRPETGEVPAEPAEEPDEHLNE